MQVGQRFVIQHMLCGSRWQWRRKGFKVTTWAAWQGSRSADMWQRPGVHTARLDLGWRQQLVAQSKLRPWLPTVIALASVTAQV